MKEKIFAIILIFQANQLIYYRGCSIVSRSIKDYIYIITYCKILRCTRYLYKKKIKIVIHLKLFLRAIPSSNQIHQNFFQERKSDRYNRIKFAQILKNRHQNFILSRTNELFRYTNDRSRM